MSLCEEQRQFGSYILGPTVNMHHILVLSLLICTPVIGYAGTHTCEKLPKDDAVELCESQNKRLPSKKDGGLYESLRKSCGSTLVIENTYGEWINNDGNIFQGNLSLNDGFCACLDMSNMTYNAEQCNRDLGHLCEVPGCEDCNDLRARKTNCFSRDGKCFFPVCDDLVWFSANNRCQEIGRPYKREMRLATPADPRQLKFKQSTCRSVWIGLRFHPSGYSSLTKKEEKNAACTLAKLTHLGMEFIATPCSKQNPFICVDNQDANGQPSVVWPWIVIPIVIVIIMEA